MAKKPTIIISDIRAGGGVLGNGMRRHSYIDYGGEVLSENMCDIPYYGENYLKRQCAETNPITGDKKLLGEHRPYITTVDYLEQMFHRYNLIKILYYHIDPNIYGDVIDYIVNKCRVIHVKRNDFLDKCISYMVANHYKIYSSHIKPPEIKEFTVNIKKLEIMFPRMIEECNKWDEIINCCESITINYDAIRNRWQDVVSDVTNFMQVQSSRRYVDKETYKIIHESRNINLLNNNREVIDWINKKGYGNYIT